MEKTKISQDLASELYSAMRNRKTIPLISRRNPEFTVEDAYGVSMAVLQHRQASGEKLVGKKIGLTAKPVQQLLGIDEPDFGFLTDAMEIPNGAAVAIADHMMTPMIEAEIALIMKAPLPTSGVTPEMVLEATGSVAACFELVDTRFDTQKIGIVDTVADNASSALYVLGDERVDPKSLDLAGVTCDVYRNGEKTLSGEGAAVMGSPLNSVAWLANKIGSFGVSIDAGDVVLPGSVVPFAPIAPGDTYKAEFEGIGTVTCRFE